MKAEEIMSLFFYRKNPFAYKIPEKHWIPVYRDVTLSDIKKHQNGYHTIGAYQSCHDETCKWGCIDFDEDSYLLISKEIYEKYNDFPSIDFTIHEKTERGTHVWFMFEKVQRTQDAFSFLETVLATYSLQKGLKTHIDIFPRSPHLSGKRVGWLVQLPRFPC